MPEGSAAIGIRRDNALKSAFAPKRLQAHEVAHHAVVKALDDELVLVTGGGA
jgi:hypothetical protein